MSEGPRYRVPYRRRREGRTDYRRRLSLLRGERPRVVVRKSLHHLSVQVVRFHLRGDEVVTSAHSKELSRFGWEGPTGNVPAAYLTGLLAARRAREAGVPEAVLDLGLYPPSRGGRVFAALRGMVDGGLVVPHGEDVLATEERVRGEHIAPEMKEAVEAVKERLEAL